MSFAIALLLKPEEKTNMPFVNIKLTGDEEALTEQQKAELIKDVTDMLAKKLGKNPQTTVVIIEEVPMANWGVGGKSIRARREEAKKIMKA